MLSRLLPKPSHFRLLYNLSSKPHSHPPAPQNPNFISFLKHFSSNQNNNSNGEKGMWKFSSDERFDSLFREGSDDGNLSGIADNKADEESWLEEKGGDEDSKDVAATGGSGGENEWLTSEGYKMWDLEDADKDNNVFDIGDVGSDGGAEVSSESRVNVESEENESQKVLEKEEKELTAILKGPNRAFGDLIAASGITDAMLDSLIALRDFEGVEGLPPLSEIEDMRYEKNTRRSTRAEIERLKQEEVAKARVRQVDDKGRAYGTGRRKCSVARVWIEPGDGKFVINDKQFDVYFPMLDHRAALLRPFAETKTLGLWDVKCTVKGGGTTGQVGAIQLGISRAMQNWEPDLRPPLRNAGFLTRDSRVVERKKPGKAKARKSFQWVKR